MIHDGHIHTPYCPHGTTDAFEKYIETALNLGYEQMTFTEHAPLPQGFTDSTPTKDSGMKSEHLQEYFFKITEMKNQYKGQITILAGLEVDYIEGFEKETTQLLNEVGPSLDDSILSVHFLKHKDSWDCLDYSADFFEGMIGRYGSLEQIHEKYYDTVLHSIKADLGHYKPKRIGHMTLVHKFKKRFPLQKSFQSKVDEILFLVAKQGLELDYNGAGFSKRFCQDSYPPEYIAQQALKLNIPLIYGSDAHQARDLGQGRNVMLK
ncbi:histidinol-phosphatase (PHP family) [Bacillus pakistanensis]|uniref:Histidinol-phosphatase n=1 Tax=Rossellomorea pakistanensis TaxID=992288 RepID=A0ABS2NB37_9BACI|nr:histidinol-phosphatase HisJ [Bacillus pakistanensis]MBM7584974.1 histidinol-phosphatase (PHP family) [Bacillus pakistanensis]